MGSVDIMGNPNPSPIYDTVTIKKIIITNTYFYNTMYIAYFVVYNLYCTISNSSAKGGDRGQSGRNFRAGHVARGQGT